MPPSQQSTLLTLVLSGPIVRRASSSQGARPLHAFEDRYVLVVRVGSRCDQPQPGPSDDTLYVICLRGSRFSHHGFDSARIAIQVPSNGFRGRRLSAGFKVCLQLRPAHKGVLTRDRVLRIGKLCMRIPLPWVVKVVLRVLLEVIEVGSAPSPKPSEP